MKTKKDWTAVDVLRYTAFSTDPDGGNPAGVVLEATGASDGEMLAVAAEVGYSETAFLVSRALGDFDVRYFSPLAEVPFCGHATIAVAVAVAERSGTGRLVLHAPVGEVLVDTQVFDGRLTATLTSVAPRTAPLGDSDLVELLTALCWEQSDLDPDLPPMVAFAGNWHPILASGTRDRLADLDYDFERLGELMARQDWTTVDLIHRATATVFHSRNPFPPGGVVEDPATGAAAAALGGYLRELGVVPPPAEILVHQGEDMGRPSAIAVQIPSSGGIRVTGAAVQIA